MKNKLNKLAAITMLASFIGFNTVQKSEAAASIFIGGPTIVLVGGIALASGMSSGVVLAFNKYDTWNGCQKGSHVWQNICDNFFQPLTFIGIIGGLIVLDDQSENTVAFSELNTKQAKDLHLSEAEVTVYHSELTKLNLVREQVYSEIKGLDQKSEHSLDQSQAIWKKYLNLLSPETVKVAGTISAQSFSK